MIDISLIEKEVRDYFPTLSDNDIEILFELHSRLDELKDFVPFHGKIYQSKPTQEHEEERKRILVTAYNMIPYTRNVISDAFGNALACSMEATEFVKVLSEFSDMDKEAYQYIKDGVPPLELKRMESVSGICTQQAETGDILANETESEKGNIQNEKEPRKEGSHKRTFKELINLRDKDGALKAMHDLIDWEICKPTKAAMYIYVLRQYGYIDRPTPEQVIAEFHTTAKESTIRKPLAKSFSPESFDEVAYNVAQTRTKEALEPFETTRQ